MSTDVLNHHGHAVDHHAQEEDSKVVFGFWLYLLSDCLLFGTLFATFAVLHGNTFGGPGPKTLFDLKFVFAETMFLLISSFTYGLAMLSVYKKAAGSVLFWLFVTFAFGAAFLGFELYEFHHLVVSGNSWSRSGFLSSFFTLVGTHGFHVFCGLIWMAVMMFQVATCGINRRNVRRLTMLSLFWHFLDLVWICVFSVVYLLGAV